MTPAQLTQQFLSTPDNLAELFKLKKILLYTKKIEYNIILKVTIKVILKKFNCLSSDILSKPIRNIFPEIFTEHVVVSVLDSPAIDPRSNPGSGSALLMSEKSQAVYYISSCHMLIDNALSSDKPNGHWFEADWLHCKRDELSNNQKVDGSRLTRSTQACHS